MVANLIEQSQHTVPGSPIRSMDFNFMDYFHGHTRASGWFSDRFGKPRRHFCGDFYGHLNGDELILDERLYYSDGVSEHRVWTITVDPQGVFRAQSESLINGAQGIQKNDSLHMQYEMKVNIGENRFWDLDMRDTMVLQPDGRVHNTTHVHKWGVRIGTVSAVYFQHEGDQSCADQLLQKPSHGTLKSVQMPAQPA